MIKAAGLTKTCLKLQYEREIMGRAPLTITQLKVTRLKVKRAAVTNSNSRPVETVHETSMHMQSLYRLKYKTSSVIWNTKLPAVYRWPESWIQRWVKLRLCTEKWFHTRTGPVWATSIMREQVSDRPARTPRVVLAVATHNSLSVRFLI